MQIRRSLYAATLLASLLAVTLLVYLITVSAPRTQAGGSPASRPAAAAVDDGPENAQVVRSAFTRLLAKDDQAESKLLAFYLGGEDKGLGIPRGWSTHRYAESLAFLELILGKHEEEAWDQILDRRDSLANLTVSTPGAWPAKPVVPLHPGRLDRLWSQSRLEQRIHDLDSKDPKLAVPAIRELRVFDALSRIPEKIHPRLDAALQCVARTASQTSGIRARLQLLLLLAHLFPRPTDLNDFVRTAAKNESPQLVAAALRAGLYFPHAKELQNKAQKEQADWRRFRLSLLGDPRPTVAHAAFVSLVFDSGEKDPASRILQKKALDYLQSAPRQALPTQVVLASIGILAESPYDADENPSPAQWQKLLRPLVRSEEVSIRAALPELILHRLPESREARTILATLASDRVSGVREAALDQFWNLDLDRLDLPWLKKLLGEKQFLLRIRLMSSILMASRNVLDEECAKVVVAWAKDERKRAKKHPANNLFAGWLNLLAYCERLPKAGRKLAMESLHSKNSEWARSARRALAAHGLLPQSVVDHLQSLLPSIQENDRRDTVEILCLQAMAAGSKRAASSWLDEILKDRQSDPAPQGLCLPLRLALRGGTLTHAQAHALVVFLGTEWIDNMTPWSREDWHLLSTLGDAWTTEKEFLEMDQELLEESVRARSAGWFEDRKNARGLALLLESLTH